MAGENQNGVTGGNTNGVGPISAGVAAATAAQNPVTASAQVPMSSTTQVAAPASSPAGGTGSVVVAGGTTPQPAAPQTPSWRDQFSQYGVDLSRFQDDAAAAQHLGQIVQQAKQLQQYAPYVQQILPHWQEFQDWRTKQQPAAPANQDSPWWSDYWNPPEYDPSWLQFLERDPNTGEIRAKAGAPPDLPIRYSQWEHYKTQQAEKLMSNPFAYFEKAFETVAERKAKEIIQQSMGQQQEVQTTQQFIDQNAAWLYQRDANGNVMVSPWLNPQTGRLEPQPVLSPYGAQFKQYVNQAAASGITSLAKQKEYALAFLERDLAIQRLQAAPPMPPVHPQQQQIPQQQAPQQQAGFNFQLQPPVHQPNFGGSVPPPYSPAPQPVQNGSLSLGDMLRHKFAQNGVTDSTIQNSR